jgi:outer membrane receptor protein involved in Fe transport
MNINHKVLRAIAAILGANGSALAIAATTAADTSGNAGASLEEIVVTAQRRSENIQDVPIAIQAFTGETLQQLNVANFDDFIKYLPNVAAASAAPGQAQIFMRGLGAGDQGTQSGGSINGFPNVAIYLDDQSGQLPGRNLDVYAADLERIEVLEGPQGTLFGSGAQAGVIRYITNKPKLNGTDIHFNTSYGVTAGGDPNSSATLVANVPLIDDKLAVRGVIYNDRRGGYINNVPGTFTRKPTDLGIHYAGYPSTNGTCPDGNSDGGSGFCVPPGAPQINNYNIARSAINPVTYQGVRLSALWQINEDWDALITQSYQDIDAQGVFYQMPKSSDGVPLPAQSVTLFNNSYSRDKFENTAWTVNGRFGKLKAVYTGSYLVRKIDEIQDYTNYSRGVYADYYQCHAAEPGNNLASTCYTPSSTWDEWEHNTHLSHELRLSTPDDWRVRGIAGAFWEQLQIQDRLNWRYKSLPPCTAALTTGCLTDIAPAADSSVTDPTTRQDNVSYINDVTRGYKQLAFFTSIDIDLIPKTLTLTVGTRYYHFDNYERGTTGGSFGCYEAGPAPCLNSMTSIDGEHLRTVYKGFKSRGNLTWHVAPDALVYYTWSQGFRPGAFNRSAGCYIPDALGVPQYCSPLSYTSDNLTNKEIGWKTEFFNHRLQWNGAIYQENWDNVQVDFFDPAVLGNVGFGANGPDYRIRGAEMSLVAALTRGLTAQGAISWNSSVQTNAPQLIANNPDLLNDPATAGEYGQPILSVINPYGPKGGTSPNSPPRQYNLRLRYEWTHGNYQSHVQAGCSYTAHSFTQSSANPSLSSGSNVSTTLLRFENPAITQFDAAIGIARDAWTADLMAQNLTNVIKSTYTSTNQFVVAETITRPRVIGLQVGYKF